MIDLSSMASNYEVNEMCHHLPDSLPSEATILSHNPRTETKSHRSDCNKNITFIKWRWTFENLSIQVSVLFNNLGKKQNYRKAWKLDCVKYLIIFDLLSCLLILLNLLKSKQGKLNVYKLQSIAKTTEKIIQSWQECLLVFSFLNRPIIDRRRTFVAELPLIEND